MSFFSILSGLKKGPSFDAAPVAQLTGTHAQQPARNAGPLTRPRPPRLAVVRWLLLDSWTLWCYTECSSLCFCILVFLLLLALRLMLWSEEKTPPDLSPGGVFVLL